MVALRNRRLGHSDQGFAYLWVLMAIAFMGVGMALVAEVYSTSLQRQREQDLLFIGHQFRDALARYYMISGIGGQQEYSPNLADLLQDGRSPALRRELRKIYVDPMTGKAEWGVVRVAGRIVGVYSLSDQQPIKKDGFDLPDMGFRGAKHYSDWVFTYPYDVLLRTDPVTGSVTLAARPDASAPVSPPEASP